MVKQCFHKLVWTCLTYLLGTRKHCTRSTWKNGLSLINQFLIWQFNGIKYQQTKIK